MRCLFLTPQLPYPPHKGTTLRNYNVIAGLARRHEIDLLSFDDSPRASRPSPLDSLCRRVATVPAPRRSTARRAIDTLLSRWPDMGLRLWSHEFEQRLAMWRRDGGYDVIQIEGIELARYGLIPALRSEKTLIVFDDHNAEYVLQQRIAQAERAARGWTPGAIYSTIQARKLRGFERRISRTANRVIAVSEADAAAVRQLDPALKVHVIPNGVDTTHYRRDAVAPLDLPPHAVVFTGTMDFRPNVDAVLWFAREVLPLVRASVPDAHFLIVGQRPHARLDALRGDPRIVITGGVEDTRPYIAGAAVYVIPLRMGGGTRLKLLEALALEAPIVSTTLGAEGFDLTPGQEIVLSDDAASFAQSIVALINDRTRAAALGREGRSVAVTKYDWQTIVPMFEAVYRNAAFDIS
jgi:sugar transferase (PEP-CTERM/EpsH1 system associated)